MTPGKFSTLYYKREKQKQASNNYHATINLNVKTNNKAFDRDLRSTV